MNPTDNSVNSLNILQIWHTNDSNQKKLLEAKMKQEETHADVARSGWFKSKATSYDTSKDRIEVRLKGKVAMIAAEGLHSSPPTLTRLERQYWCILKVTDQYKQETFAKVNINSLVERFGFQKADQQILKQLLIQQNAVRQKIQDFSEKYFNPLSPNNTQEHSLSEELNNQYRALTKEATELHAKISTSLQGYLKEGQVPLSSPNVDAPQAAPTSPSSSTQTPQDIAPSPQRTSSSHGAPRRQSQNFAGATSFSSRISPIVPSPKSITPLPAQEQEGLNEPVANPALAAQTRQPALPATPDIATIPEPQTPKAAITPPHTPVKQSPSSPINKTSPKTPHQPATPIAESLITTPLTPGVAKEFASPETIAAFKTNIDYVLHTFDSMMKWLDYSVRSTRRIEDAKQQLEHATTKEDLQAAAKKILTAVNEELMLIDPDWKTSTLPPHLTSSRYTIYQEWKKYAAEEAFSPAQPPAATDEEPVQRPTSPKTQSPLKAHSPGKLATPPSTQSIHEPATPSLAKPLSPAVTKKTLSSGAPRDILPQEPASQQPISPPSSLAANDVQAEEEDPMISERKQHLAQGLPALLSTLQVLLEGRDEADFLSNIEAQFNLAQSTEDLDKKVEHLELGLYKIEDLLFSLHYEESPEYDAAQKAFKEVSKHTRALKTALATPSDKEEDITEEANSPYSKAKVIAVVAVGVIGSALASGAAFYAHNLMKTSKTPPHAGGATFTAVPLNIEEHGFTAILTTVGTALATVGPTLMSVTTKWATKGIEWWSSPTPEERPVQHATKRPSQAKTHTFKPAFRRNPKTKPTVSGNTAKPADEETINLLKKLDTTPGNFSTTMIGTDTARNLSAFVDATCQMPGGWIPERIAHVFCQLVEGHASNLTQQEQEIAATFTEHLIDTINGTVNTLNATAHSLSESEKERTCDTIFDIIRGNCYEIAKGITLVTPDDFIQQAFNVDLTPPPAPTPAPPTTSRPSKMPDVTHVQARGDSLIAKKLNEQTQQFTHDISKLQKELAASDTPSEIAAIGKSLRLAELKLTNAQRSIEAFNQYIEKQLPSRKPPHQPPLS